VILLLYLQSLVGWLLGLLNPVAAAAAVAAAADEQRSLT
jgi:hypothetical protein